jgi:pyruvate/2-oxoglutarate dehydrogenase complex dihydrolipoamide dehydrogenase (E3) component
MKTAVDVEMVRNEKPDVVFLATGSIPLQSKSLQGIKKVQVFSPEDVLEGYAEVGLSVVVIGGGSAGCEIAYELADQKRNVTIIEQLPELAIDLHHANRDMLFELLKGREVKILTFWNSPLKSRIVIPYMIHCFHLNIQFVEG